MRKEDKLALRKILANEEYNYDEWRGCGNKKLSDYWLITFGEEEDRLEPAEPTESDTSIFEDVKEEV